MVISKMRTNKKIFFFVIQLTLIFVISGCEVPDARVNIILPSDKPQEQQPKQIEQRFHASTQQRPIAIKSTIELSKKYAKLAEENLWLKEKNRELIEENKGLKSHITPLIAELEQTRKELAETTELVIDMRIELNNWKTDILGFRDEIRTAEKTQLEALLKILTILGGEVKTEPKQIEDESSKL